MPRNRELSKDQLAESNCFPTVAIPAYRPLTLQELLRLNLRDALKGYPAIWNNKIRLKEKLEIPREQIYGCML